MGTDGQKGGTKKGAKAKVCNVNEEAFCQAFLLDGDAAKSYRSAYDATNMKPATVWRRACDVKQRAHVAARIEALRLELAEKNAVTLDKLVQSLSFVVNFDPLTMYDEDGNLLPINKMPEAARKMIVSFSSNKNNTSVKLLDKMAAAEKLMRYIGAYRDDAPKTQTIVYNVEVTKEEARQIAKDLENDV